MSARPAAIASSSGHSASRSEGAPGRAQVHAQVLNQFTCRAKAPYRARLPQQVPADSGAPYCVEIRPLLVETIQRLPHKTIESTLPSPGTISPRAAFRMPPGPCNTAVPSITSRTLQPSIVVGLVSGTGMGFGKIFARRVIAADAVSDFVIFCRATVEGLFVGASA